MKLASRSVQLSLRARGVWLAAFAVAAAFGLSILLLILLPSDATDTSKDFGQEYLLARAILDRVDPYQPIRDLGARYVGVSGYFDKAHPTPHPPTVGILALPLGLFSYPGAVRIWFGFELACLVAAVGLLLHGAGLPIRFRYVPILALALVAWPPMTLELGLGQLMLPLVVGLAGAQVALLHGRSKLGGGLLGLTLLIKPIAWPWLIVLAWRRDWRSLAASSMVLLVGGLLSLLAIGAASLTNYLTRILPSMSTAFLAEPTNMSLWTVAPRFGADWLSGVVPAAVLLLGAWWSCKRRPLGISLALMTVVSLLVSPILWYFYVVVALLPLAHLLAAVYRRGSRSADIAATVAVFGVLSLSQTLLTALGRSSVGSGVLIEPALALGVLGLLLIRLA